VRFDWDAQPAESGTGAVNKRVVLPWKMSKAMAAEKRAAVGGAAGAIDPLAAAVKEEVKVGVAPSVLVCVV